MTMKKYLFLFLLAITSVCLQAQQRYTISGYIRDSLSSETLIGASVTVKGEGRGVKSNLYGFYSITLPAGKYTLLCSFIGYLSQEVDIDLKENMTINFSPFPKASLSQEIVISSKRRDANVQDAQMGKIDLPMSKIRSVPVIFGEIDPLKTLQLMPGVTNAGEGNSGIYVRGGGPDQNLIMLDDAVVYNTGHLFGFFSIFNGDAIKNTSLIKGGMPAQYGGRLSSVLDISMKDGNMQKYEIDGGIGTISSRLSIQGPIVKDKASFIVSGRRTYIDLLAKPFIKKSSNFYGSGYFFYDVNAKVNYRFSDKDRLYLSGYFGRDVFDFVNAKRSFDIQIPWGNATMTARWNHVFNRKLFANTTLVYNDYNFEFGAQQSNFELKLSSGIRDLNFKSDFDYYASPKHKMKFGGLYTRHRFTPSVISGKQDTTEFEPNNSQVKFANEAALYVQDDWELSDKLKVNAGIRYSWFQQTGPYKKYLTDDDGNKLDSVSYGSSDVVKTYGGLEPRLTIRYAFDEETSVKAAVTRNLQYIHLVSNAGTTLPTDVWVPSTYRVNPQISWQYALGMFKNFDDNKFETSIEVYYKSMKNQIEYKEGYTPSIRDTEEEFVFGDGWSYGAEFFINKSRGKLTGWIGYTLAWTWRKFPQLNQGNKYPAKYDRRHDLSVVAIYELSPKWKLSGVFVFATGNATTLPERFYIMEGVLTQEYSDINQYRLDSYHRLDFAATYTPKPNSKKRWKSSWVFSIYNIYSRANPYFIYFDQSGSPYDGSLQVQAKQVSLFPIIPSITYNFKF
ncbi:TonB-dependent receptor [Pollutibacter soli]|uniref:TonB-dependent receptor n=1 Tax=Pollutibacter soli TaxID=3034157 RepID=UPI003013DE84